MAAVRMARMDENPYQAPTLDEAERTQSEDGSDPLSIGIGLLVTLAVIGFWFGLIWLWGDPG